MEQAIEVMNGSQRERRSDGKTSPLVGAVLWKPDGTIETACRGELRDGDHAEYTLLERKNRGARLDGSVLFCTLEPCAPGARNHPKLGCAERIVLARIAEVWVGVTDPDPTVDRKGIQHLQDHGVRVQMFHRDLQERIRAANRRFIEQAERRRREVTKAGPAALSDLEDSPQASQLRDLDQRALADYRRDTGVRDAVDSAEFQRRLVQQGLLHATRGKLTPTGFGLILFGKEPRVRVPQAGLLATMHHAEGSEETRDFDGPAIAVPQQALDWLRAKLPNPISRTQARRGEANATLFELLREGIVNALVHRDYDIKGAKCQLEVHPDRIVVRSPGGPVPPITLEQIQKFDAPMLSRNPVLHYVFAKLQLAEERGLGLKSMRAKAVAVGLPLPSYSYHAPYMVLTIWREAAAAVRSRGVDIEGQLSAAERDGWSWLASRESTRVRDYVRAMQVPSRTAKRHLRKLMNLGLLRRVGAGRATRYEVAHS
ncbi:MAG: ATP-binding protein [Planctomycetota bacterium]